MVPIPTLPPEAFKVRDRFLEVSMAPSPVIEIALPATEPAMEGALKEAIVLIADREVA